MNPLAARVFSGVAVVLIFVLSANPLGAQQSGSTVSGTVTNTAGKAAPGTKVWVKNLDTGQSSETQTDSAGQYSVQNLAPGNYEISASAEGVGTSPTKVNVAAGVRQSVNLTLSPAPVQQAPGGAEGVKPSENLPSAPSSTKTEPSLEDLGFSKSEEQGNAQQQALLDKRTHMLKIHQRLGLIAAAPLVASVVTSFGAGGKSTSRTSRDVHLALGAAAGDLYFTSAYFAIRAPKIKGTETRGPIRVHKALAWIHGPGMILTPILGAMAYEQKSKGEKVHGIAAAHGPVAIVTAGAFGAALLSVSVKF